MTSPVPVAPQESLSTDLLLLCVGIPMMLVLLLAIFASVLIQRHNTERQAALEVTRRHRKPASSVKRTGSTLSTVDGDENISESSTNVCKIHTV